MQLKAIAHLGLLLLYSFTYSIVSYAAPDSVALVLSDESAPYQEFAQRFRATAEGRGVRVSMVHMSQVASVTDVELIVPVGVRATEATIRAAGTVPVLSTLIPRATFAHLSKIANARDRAFSAIYLDQPLTRRMALVNEALPGRKKIGVLLGPESAGELRYLQSAALDKGFVLVSERVDQADDLLPALKRILIEADLLLAMPDPLVFNRNTAQSILLTSYRAQDPVVAYSASYVSAGALLAVYSTPAQMGQQAAELVLKLAKSAGPLLPPPQYPTYFSVSVNTQVARSMGLEIAHERVLFERLMAVEARE